MAYDIPPEPEALTELVNSLTPEQRRTVLRLITEKEHEPLQAERPGTDDATETPDYLSKPVRRRLPLAGIMDAEPDLGRRFREYRAAEIGDEL